MYSVYDDDDDDNNNNCRHFQTNFSKKRYHRDICEMENVQRTVARCAMRPVTGVKDKRLAAVDTPARHRPRRRAQMTFRRGMAAWWTDERWTTRIVDRRPIGRIDRTAGGHLISGVRCVGGARTSIVCDKKDSVHAIGCRMPTTQLVIHCSDRRYATAAEVATSTFVHRVCNSSKLPCSCLYCKQNPRQFQQIAITSNTSPCIYYTPTLFSTRCSSLIRV